MYVCCWSGGKDSTASIILARENNEPLDLIIFSEVMFSLSEDISGENPEHIRFVKDVAIPMFESWGYKVEIVRAKTDFLDSFYRIIEHPRKHEEHKGMKNGFPGQGCCIRRDCKVKPITERLASINGPVYQYMGIARDEPKRLKSMPSNAISLLDKYGYTEKDAFELCERYGLVSPSYKYSARGGCWFCPNAKICECKAIKEANPDAWNRYISLENEANVANYKWNVYSNQTLKARDREVDMLIAQTSLFSFEL